MSQLDIYEQLAEMFDRAPLGLAKTPSMMELLRLQYTPAEAELAVKMGFNALRLDELQQKVGIETEQLKSMLNTMADKGTMWITPGQDDPKYSPVREGGPGLIETGAWGNVRFPHSVPLMKALHRVQREFAVQRLSKLGFTTSRVWASPTALPKDAEPTENVAEMIKLAGYWSVSTCSCRLPHWMADPGNHCTHLLETCLLLGKLGQWAVEHGMSRRITYDEAVEILRRSNEDGLVHTYDPNQAICNCCADCCVFLVGMRETGARTLEPSPFVARINEETCSACGVCADRCPADAIEVGACSTVDESLCLGCGVCVPSCRTGSAALVRRLEARPTSATA
jgi:electron transport complex protein RnfB